VRTDLILSYVRTAMRTEIGVKGKSDLNADENAKKSTVHQPYISAKIWPFGIGHSTAYTRVLRIYPAAVPMAH
jgi:hypothetical protein